MYKNMAVAYDGSDGSRLAFDKAVEMKQALPDIKLSIIYVNEEFQENVSLLDSPGTSAPIFSPTLDSTSTQSLPPVVNDEEYDSAQGLETSPMEYSKYMHNSIQQQLDAKGVEASVLALEGTASKTIPAFIEEQKIDLLVVGNSGKSGLQKFFVGSVSRKLIKEAACSVLVVK
ncbi:universal stress protein [Planococcus salinus]|uniref:Universal stress protein n=1 Tax=Planococcus salinus TaxID=1848460 RepID=A0A3M8P6Y3_9BACL|nr:universal stress protein [Planococcus salinus]RNF39425.1 universal stress protein [Planococcus salinus]